MLLIDLNAVLTGRHGSRKGRDHGGTDAEPRWIPPRGIPRPGQRGVDSSGRIIVCSFRRVAEGGGRGGTEQGTKR
jgi:hypothetical protein